MSSQNYLMEGDEESIRLDLKTSGRIVEEQGRWAGIRPGMRVGDLGCGAGKTAFHLNKLVQPNGKTVGVDFAEQRIQYANTHYCAEGIEFVVKDIRYSLEDLELFDFIWVRFVLEYYRSNSFDIVSNIDSILKPGGTICLIDLDCNCLRHYGMPQRLENSLKNIMETLEENLNFDPYVGVKLYSYLYDLGYQQISVNVTPHNLIFGELKMKDEFNWEKKVEIAAKNSGYQFDEYPGGYEEFFDEFMTYFFNFRRFTYTPMISCKGIKPA